MITKYKIQARWPKAEIEVVEVVRETAQCVFLPSTHRRDKNGERKELKRSEWHEYYDTWDAAHAALMAKAESRLNAARRRLQDAQGLHGNVKGMRPND